jgi:ribonuclease HII
VAIEGVDDSKKLSVEDRERLEALLTAPGGCFHFAAAFVEPARIDEINIRMATLEAMKVAASTCAALLPAGSRALVLTDGRDPTPMPDPSHPSCSIIVESRAIKGGDAEVYSIAAASIIAKVRRDALMRAYASQWPQYNFEQHKGYGTANHMALLAEHGPCEIHRRSYAPVREALERGKK